jgi:uncharacterized membrane protein YidH (DUF202 family)
MKALGIVLVVLGVLGLVSGGLSWTRNKTVIDAGPIEVTAQERESLPIPPVAGGLLVIAGVAILLKGGKK